MMALVQEKIMICPLVADTAPTLRSSMATSNFSGSEEFTPSYLKRSYTIRDVKMASLAAQWTWTY